MNTIYISIQQVDWDDYPLGSDTKIGPFESTEAAEQFLETNTKFRKKYYAKDAFSWELDRGYRHSITIRDLLETYMTSPEDYDK